MTSMFGFIPVKSAPMVLAAAVTTTMLAGCGGGGGGGDASASTPRTITPANQKQIVAIVINATDLADGDTVVQEDEDASAAAMLRQSKQAAVKLRQARAVHEVEGYCISGRMLFDDETGEETYENCAWPLASDTMQLIINGSMTSEDLIDDATATGDSRITYSNYSTQLLFANLDHITTMLNGFVTDTYTETTFQAESDLSFSTTFTCKGVSGSYGGSIKLSSTGEELGDESAYNEEGEMTLTGFPEFNGTLAISTLEPMRYRDDYNDNFPYAGKMRISAADGSSVEISFAEGGIYVGGEFFTFEQYEQQFVANNLLAPCLTAD